MPGTGPNESSAPGCSAPHRTTAQPHVRGELGASEPTAEDDGWASFVFWCSVAVRYTLTCRVGQQAVIFWCFHISSHWACEKSFSFHVSFSYWSKKCWLSKVPNGIVKVWLCELTSPQRTDIYPYYCFAFCWLLGLRSVGNKMLNEKKGKIEVWLDHTDPVSSLRTCIYLVPWISTVPGLREQAGNGCGIRYTQGHRSGLYSEIMQVRTSSLKTRAADRALVMLHSLQPPPALHQCVPMKGQDCPDVRWKCGVRLCHV